MKNTELRIGNLVHHNQDKAKEQFLNIYLTVCSVSEDGVTTYYTDIRGGERQIVLGKTNYQPIPLTEEWLKRFGFVNDKAYKVRWYLYINSNLLFTYDIDDNCICIFDNWLDHKIQFVHQLQNLYFSLKNKELEIKQ